MKPTGRHPVEALTAVKVRNIKKPGRYADGNGLYLVVDPSGARRWLLRTVVRGKRRDMGLGGTSLVTLSEAREMARQYRRIARAGGDPIANRSAESEKPTFKEAAEAVHTIHKEGWKNGKHVNQWLSSLEAYAFPSIGERRVDHIDTAALERVLQPIWLEKPETARRVRQRIKTVLDWAATKGYREGANPAVTVGPGLPRQNDKKRQKHHAAMPYAEVPAFVQTLRADGDGEIVRLALEWTILTAARTSETIGATFEELDAGEAVWTVPAERMKGGKLHRVPLPARCIEIVERAKEIGNDSPYLFPGAKRGRHLSDMAMLMALRRLDVPFTVHGFRSSFRDWTAEQTSTPRDVAEGALAHAVEDKVEAAYRRSDLFARRRNLMDTWAAYIDAEGHKVIAFPGFSA
jgi:integrase